jgi:hypothetical protein
MYCDCNRYSWSTNICGAKRWLLYPPHATAMLQDKFGQLATDRCSLILVQPCSDRHHLSLLSGVQSVWPAFIVMLTPHVCCSLRGYHGTDATNSRLGSPDDMDTARFPRLSEARTQCIEVLQAEGETIFVPARIFAFPRESAK